MVKSNLYVFLVSCILKQVSTPEYASVFSMISQRGSFEGWYVMTVICGVMMLGLDVWRWRTSFVRSCKSLEGLEEFGKVVNFVFSVASYFRHDTGNLYLSYRCVRV